MANTEGETTFLKENKEMISTKTNTFLLEKKKFFFTFQFKKIVTKITILKGRKEVENY